MPRAGNFESPGWARDAAHGHGGAPTGVALARPLNAIAWELRAAWASGRRVALRVDADHERIEGWVTGVAATGAYVHVGRVHVPLERVLSVHHPSRLGDSTIKNGAWAHPGRKHAPQTEALWAT